MTLLRNYLTALILAALGVYVLREWHDTPGLLVGTGAVLLAIQIALATPLGEGLVKLKGNITLIVPVIVDALKGGKRKTDPPKDAGDL